MCERHTSGSYRGPPEKDLNHRHLADGLPMYPRFCRFQGDVLRLSQRSDLRQPEPKRTPSDETGVLPWRLQTFGSSEDHLPGFGLADDSISS